MSVLKSCVLCEMINSFQYLETFNLYFYHLCLYKSICLYICISISSSLYVRGKGHHQHHYCLDIPAAVYPHWYLVFFYFFPPKLLLKNPSVLANIHFFLSMTCLLTLFLYWHIGSFGFYVLTFNPLYFQDSNLILMICIADI